LRRHIFIANWERGLATGTNMHISTEFEIGWSQFLLLRTHIFTANRENA